MTARPTRIPATSDNGTGLILPITKALTHIMTIYTAITREWPLSVADATAELEEANRHIEIAIIPRALMTTESIDATSGWLMALSDQLTLIRSNLDLDALIGTIEVEPFKALATNTWQLLTVLDRELTGLEPNSADPGRLP